MPTQALSHRSSAVRLRPDDLTDLDYLIYESREGYSSDYAAERVRWIAEAASFHRTHCPEYDRLARSEGFDPDTVETEDDLARVPLLTTGIFKKRAVVSKSDVELIRCESSGTQGAKSVLLRDGVTMERFVGSMMHGIREFYGAEEERAAYVLGPPTEQASDLWFSYVLGLVELRYEADFFVEDERFDPSALYEALRSADDDLLPALIGPPSLVVDFIDWMDHHHCKLDLGSRGGVLVTAGGWKKRGDEQVDRETMTTRVGERLGLEREAVRDLFNMAELNTVIFECEHLRKHVPPWLTVLVRRPRDLTVASPGEVGILSYLDPTAASYPCFILSDDLGTVSDEPCPCGRRGPVLELARRLTRVEERGCGAKMDRYGRAAG